MPKGRGRYNWDGRYISQPASDREGPSLARRVFIPTGALALLAGVAFGAFYLMHTFAAGPNDAVAGTAPAAKAETTVAAVAGIPEAPARAETEKAAPAGAVTVNAAARSDPKPVSTTDVAGRVASSAAAAKVPAPDNARWGRRAVDEPAAQTAKADEATAAPKVNDPQSAPVPTEAPKMAATETAGPKTAASKAETPKKLAYAAPSEASAHPVDKAVTAALPPASPPKDDALPGVDANPLSVPARASAEEGDDAAGGYLSTANTDVKLHAGPSNGSRSIGVVPRKASVRVLSCKGWCKVSYQGREGYIYKSFLGHMSAAPAATQKAAPEKTAAAPQAQAAQPGAPAPADAKALEEAAKRTITQGR